MNRRTLDHLGVILFVAALLGLAWAIAAAMVEEAKQNNVELMP